MLEKSQIEDLLPHRGSMFLLDRAVRFDEDEIECCASSHRSPNNPLRHHGRLPAHVAIEYAAQAAGLHGALLNRGLRLDSPPQVGYLAIVSNLLWSVDRLDDLTNDLQVYARRTVVGSSGCAYRVRVEHLAEPVMSGDLIIALEPATKIVAGRE